MPVVPSHKRADGATETGRPARVGSAAQGVACSSPVGTITTGREPSRGAMGAMNMRSRRSTARASCPSAPVPRAACVPPYARRRKANLTWLSSWRTSALEAM